MWLMLAGRGDIKTLKEKHLYVSSLLSPALLIAFFFLALIFLLPSDEKSSETSSPFKNKEIFSDLDKAKEIFFTVFSLNKN